MEFFINRCKKKIYFINSKKKMLYFIRYSDKVSLLYHGIDISIFKLWLFSIKTFKRIHFSVYYNIL